MTARNPRLAIIGGAIAGLAATMARHRCGIEIAVCEQAGEAEENCA